MLIRNLGHTFILSLLLLFTGLLIAEIAFEERYQQQAEIRYEQVVSEADKIVTTLIEANHEKVAMEALYLSQSKDIQQAFLQKNPQLLDFDKVFAQRSKFTSINDAYVQLIDAQGYSLYRSWTDLKGDQIVDFRKDLQQFFKKPQIMNTISMGIYDLSMKTIVPIYYEGQFLGAFEVIRTIRDVVEQMESTGLIPFILGAPSYKSQLLNQEPGQYINDAYIVNYPLDQRAVTALINKKLDQVAAEHDYYVCNDTRLFVSFKHLYALDGSSLATVYLFQPLNPIQVDFKQPKNQVMLALLILFIAFWTLFHLAKILRKNRMATQNIDQLKNVVQVKDLQLQRQNLFWQKVIDGLHDIVLVVDKSQQHVLLNQAANKMLPLRSNHKRSCHVCSKALLNNKELCPDIDEQCAIRQAFSQKRVVTSIEEIDINGETRYLEFTASPSLDRKGKVTQIIEVGHDITPYMHAKQQLEKQKQNLDEIAYFDSLTGLPNRRLFSDRLKQSINLAKRNKSKLVLMFIDLDYFKQINDTYGHEVGDDVLVKVAERLQMEVRSSDTVSRLGGDEFTIILEQVEHAEMVVELVSNILNAIREPLMVRESRFYLTTSIGISVYPDDGEKLQDLIKHADIAMYQAKEKGRNSYAFYNADMTKQAMQRLELENKLRDAIEDNQFEVYFQPQYDLISLEIIGFEALVRWHHPQLGLVLPFEFIAIAEESGLIVPIGEIVLREAMKTIRQWHDKHLTTQRMAINISARQFANEDLLQTMKSILAETGCQPELIELEITETSVMKNKNYAAKVLSELKHMGVAISIDDFGTGYSSLAELKRMPIDKIKIDQSFIVYLPHDNEDAEITKTIITMGQNLEMQTIAEGIENAAQVYFLQTHGCSQAQGNFLSEPLSKTDMESLLLQEKVKQAG